MSDLITAAESIDSLGDELIETLWIEEMFGEEALESLAEDWCRSQHSVEEIVERRRLAGIAPVTPLPASSRRRRAGLGARAA